MKIKETTSLILLVAVFLCALSVGAKAEKMCDRLLDLITASEALSINGQEQLSAVYTEKAGQIWRENDSFIRIFLSHTDAELAASALQEYIGAVKLGLRERPAKAALLCCRLEALKENEKLSFKSLL